MEMKNENGTSPEDQNQPLNDFFRKIAEQSEPPAKLKESVFAKLDSFQLLMDITDLFTTKFTKAETQFFDTLNDNKSDQNSV